MGVGLTTLTCKKKKASKKFSRILRMRPRPTLGCGAKERRRRSSLRIPKEGDVNFFKCINVKIHEMKIHAI
jgi:hypothetical protein